MLLSRWRIHIGGSNCAEESGCSVARWDFQTGCCAAIGQRPLRNAERKWCHCLSHPGYGVRLLAHGVTKERISGKLLNYLKACRLPAACARRRFLRSVRWLRLGDDSQPRASPGTWKKFSTGRSSRFGGGGGWLWNRSFGWEGATVAVMAAEAPEEIPQRAASCATRRIRFAFMG